MDIAVCLFSTSTNPDRWIETDIFLESTHFSSNRDFPACGSACRGIFDNRLEYQFVLNHLGTFLIFPWHSFDYQARFWHIMVQLVASNGAKLLSQLIANTTFNLSEIAWKHPFFPLSRVPRTCGRCVTQLRFSRCSGRRAGCCGESLWTWKVSHLRTCLTASAVNIIMNSVYLSTSTTSWNNQNCLSGWKLFPCDVFFCRKVGRD